MNICLVVRSLTTGGAQVQCVRIAHGLLARGHKVSLVVFYPGGQLVDLAQEYGVPVYCLNKRSRWNLWAPLRRFVAHCRRERCDVLYTFLPMENLVGLLVSRRVGIPVVWSLRIANTDRWQFGWASGLLYLCQELLLARAAAIISNSRAALVEWGLMEGARVHVIGNGVDVSKFRPNKAHRRSFRASHGLAEEDAAVGIVARIDKMKDHATFLRAAALIAARKPAVRFIIAGSGPEAYVAELVDLARKLGIDRRVLWLGEITRPEVVYNALDVAVLSSRAEGLPNVLLEALACGVPTVATDVGDSALVTAGFGRIVPPGSPSQLAEAVLMTIDERPTLVPEDRWLYVCENFSAEATAEKTEAALAAVLAQSSERRPLRG